MAKGYSLESSLASGVGSRTKTCGNLRVRRVVVVTVLVSTHSLTRSWKRRFESTAWALLGRRGSPGRPTGEGEGVIGFAAKGGALLPGEDATKRQNGDSRGCQEEESREREARLGMSVGEAKTGSSGVFFFSFASLLLGSMGGGEESAWMSRASRDGAFSRWRQAGRGGGGRIWKAPLRRPRPVKARLAADRRGSGSPRKYSGLRRYLSLGARVLGPGADQSAACPGRRGRASGQPRETGLFVSTHAVKRKQEKTKEAVANRQSQPPRLTLDAPRPRDGAGFQRQLRLLGRASPYPIHPRPSSARPRDTSALRRGSGSHSPGGRRTHSLPATFLHTRRKNTGRETASVSLFG